MCNRYTADYKLRAVKEAIRKVIAIFSYITFYGLVRQINMYMICKNINRNRRSHSFLN